MSQYLVVFYNATSNLVQFVNTEDTDNNRAIIAGTMFRTQTQFNVPDDSDPSKWFAAHHMEIRDELGNPLLSFWDDDANSYQLMVCNGTNYQTATDMPGWSNGGNGATVGLILTQPGPKTYTLTAYPVDNNA